jgi:methyltransferase family protein
MPWYSSVETTRDQMKKEPTPDAILQLGLAFWGSKTLLSAVELGLFTELAKGPRDKDTLRVSMGIDGRSVGDFLDALVALGMPTGRPVSTAIRRRPISSSTATRQPTSAASLKWRRSGSSASGIR